MSRNARTTEFLKDCMADALIKLLGEKRVEKITVPEIVAAAGVGRTTWFRCFGSKYEAVVWRLTRLYSAWAAEGDRGTVFPPIESYREFLAYNYKIRKLLLALYGTGLKGAVEEAVLSLVPASADRYLARLYGGAVFGPLDEWIEGGMSDTPARVFMATHDALPKLK